MRASSTLAHDLPAETENGQMLERLCYEDLIGGSQLTMDEVMRRVQTANWYVPVDEALRLGWVAGLV